MEDVCIANWTELNEQLYSGSWQEPLGRFRSPFVYRGTPSAQYDLVTGLGRLGGQTSLEEHMLRAFRRYAGNQLQEHVPIWNWLALAQHHGLCTRLLDWTYSPLVAAHFATGDIEAVEEDGVIWCVDHTKTNAMLPPLLKTILEEEGTAVFTADMLARAATTLREFDLLSDDPFVAFFEPPSLDERIVNQYALFSLVSDPHVDLGDWLAEHDNLFRRVIIPAEVKPEVRDKLDQSNITERVLYPGLDGISKWLNRYYRPRPHAGAEVDQPAGPPGH